MLLCVSCMHGLLGPYLADKKKEACLNCTKARVVQHYQAGHLHKGYTGSHLGEETAGLPTGDRVLKVCAVKTQPPEYFVD